MSTPRSHPPGRAAIEEALHEARVAAYPAEEYVGQEGFMLARDIRALARQAGVGRDVEVADLCCGSGGPGRHLVRTLGCHSLGVDESAEMIMLARERAGDLPVRYEVAHLPPVRATGCEVVLLLETMLAFSDKRALLTAIADGLPPGGRFACTVEAGAPLSPEERAAMPHADTVWPVPSADLETLLAEVGLRCTWRREDTVTHRTVVDALIGAVTARRREIAARLGAGFVDDLLAAHRLWSAWLQSGRIRKYALVARKGATPANVAGKAEAAAGSRVCNGHLFSR